MKCPFCDSEMLWDNDVDLEDISIFDEKGIISRFICINEKCNCEAEFTLREGEE